LTVMGYTKRMLV